MWIVLFLQKKMQVDLSHDGAWTIEVLRIFQQQRESKQTTFETDIVDD